MTAVPSQVILSVKPSEIHGNGVFAGSDIAQGELIGRFPAAPLGRSETVLVHASDAASRLMRYQGEWFIPGKEAFWLNHADQGKANTTWAYNSATTELQLVADRSIRVDDEILIDYGCGGLGIPPSFRVNALRS